MLTTTAALEAVLDAMPAFTAGPVSLDSAVGRVLRQNIVAERDQPPFDRVMMDGIAIAYADFASGQRDFTIQATQAAGDARLTLEPGNAIEIMTGASLPDGADCIIPVERIEVAKGTAHIEANYGASGRQFIHPRGSDHALSLIHI